MSHLEVPSFSSDDEITSDFVRGSSFAFIMELPENILAGQLSGYTLSCQLRKLANDGPSGLISAIPVSFTDADCIAIQFLQNNTEDWPVGPAEFDVLFTKTADPNVKHRSKAVKINIVNGVTQ